MKAKAKVSATHTPGPWRLKQIGDELYVEHEGGMVCDMQFGEIQFADNPESEARSIRANARLIAAAPELLQTIKDIQHNAQVMNKAEPNRVWNAVDDQCCAAITMAEQR